MPETKTRRRWNNQNKMEIILKLAVSASLGSLGIVISTIVVFVPNIEFVSVSIFLISILFGVYYGLLAAVSIPIVYEFIITAIVGPAGLLIPFKIFCYIGLALIAGLGRKVFLKLSFWELGVLGSIFAIFYDLITTIGYYFLYYHDNLSIQLLLSLLAFGAIHSTIHIIGNFAIFSLTKTIINWITAAFQARGIKLLMLPFINNESVETSDQIKSGGKT